MSLPFLVASPSDTTLMERVDLRQTPDTHSPTLELFNIARNYSTQVSESLLFTLYLPFVSRTAKPAHCDPPSPSEESTPLLSDRISISSLSVNDYISETKQADL